jgi:Phospholipase_D-nuclease N-terminal
MGSVKEAQRMEGPGIGIPELLVTFVVLPQLGLQVYALVDVLRVPNGSRFQTGTKLIWVLVVLLLGCVGGIVYFIIGRPRRT